MLMHIVDFFWFQWLPGRGRGPQVYSQPTTKARTSMIAEYLGHSQLFIRSMKNVSKNLTVRLPSSSPLLY